MADSQRKTANLFDKDNFTFGTGTTIVYVPLYVGDGTFTLSTDFPDNATKDVFFLSGNVSTGASSQYSGVSEGHPLSRESIDGYVTVATRYNTARPKPSDYNYMLNTGSTPLPYEPYGWLHSLRKLGTSTDTITTLPDDIYANDNNATVGLVGNMSQTGTPSPTTPIQPNECGERTGNLIGKFETGYYINNANGQTGSQIKSASTDYVEVTGNTSYYITPITSGNWGAWYDANKNFISGITGYSAVTSPNNAKYARMTVSYNESNPNYATNFMMNLGSSPLPYEPYGYKIPISSANTTTPIYLGEVQTTRKIGKLVLTGGETWGNSNNIVYLNNFGVANLSPLVCSHFANVQDTGMWNGNNWVCQVDISRHGMTTRSDWIAYLQQQYANGTPVCVWYALAEPTTGIVNEPLRKIGDYADEVSGITIPTITGADSFDVLTTLKPSEVSLAYTGWHDATVKEWDGSEWQ